MSSFQDLYEHAAADRDRAMQFLAIKEIRRKAVKELEDAGVYKDPTDDNMTDEELSNRRAEAAYIFGLRSVVKMTKLPDQEGDEVYGIEVKDSSSRPYCIALCIQTKMEELRANGSEKNSASGKPLFYVVVSNDFPNESVDTLREALEILKVAYPAWRITMEVRDEQAKARVAMAENLRSIIEKVQKEQTQERTQELFAALMATPLVFPAQRPAGAPQPMDGEQVHLQFGKAKAQDGKSYFLAFTDRSQLFKWRQFGSVELMFEDYSKLIMNSKDEGLILDPYVGANMCVTREMIQGLQAQYEMINNFMQMAADMQDGVIEEEPEKKNQGYQPQKPKVNEWWKK